MQVPLEVVHGLLDPGSDVWGDCKPAWRACVTLMARHGLGPAKITVAGVGTATGSKGSPDSVARAGRRALENLRQAGVARNVEAIGWVFNLHFLAEDLDYMGGTVADLMLTPRHAQSLSHQIDRARDTYVEQMARAYAEGSLARQRVVARWLEDKPALLEMLRSGPTDPQTLAYVKRVEAVTTPEQADAFIPWPVQAEVAPRRDTEATNATDGPAGRPAGLRRLRTTVDHQSVEPSAPSLSSYRRGAEAQNSGGDDAQREPAELDPADWLDMVPPDPFGGSTLDQW